MDWTQTNVHSTLFICWGGMAVLHHFHGVRSTPLPAKAFGCFRHQDLDAGLALPARLLGRASSIPVSR